MFGICKRCRHAVGGLSIAGGLAVTLFAAACTTGAKSDPTPRPRDPDPALRAIREEARGVFDAPPADAPRGTPARPSSGDRRDAGLAGSEWSIVIAAVRGDEDALARQTLTKVQGPGGLRDAYLERRGKATVVAYGRYADPASDEARRDLESIRAKVIEGGTPFAGAILAPPTTTPPGSIPEFDLSTVRARQALTKAAYTLQVAAYERGDGKDPSPADTAEIRANAERAAAQLRREGDEAYYFHGPRRSMVTIGLFSAQDFDIQDKSRHDPRLAMLRAKYPYNLVNGAGLKTRARGQSTAQLQKSFMVQVP